MAEWYKREVTIIPSLIIGCGGTGVGVVRHLKRRVRLAWNGNAINPTPDLIQFYGIDTVSYANRPDQEFLSPSEYGFMGGFDPKELISQKDIYRSIAHWWHFDEKLIPSGLIHLGARQIRALGRLALYYAFPEVWFKIKDKLDIINQISSATQAIRAGYDVPIDTSSRQVIIVSSICGGTGAGCFLDIAARIRAYTTTKVKIIGIFVLPSAFARELPSQRQRERTQGNAYAAIRELDGFWYSVASPSPDGATPAIGRRPFETLFPGDGKPTRLEHAIFDEIYLIGREGRRRSLTTLDDVMQQIAHFLYLTTIHNIAGPLGERKVNLDRTRQFYSSFAVGALSLPDRKIADSLLATLQVQLLTNLIKDNRANKYKENLSDEIDSFYESLVEFAENLMGDLADATPEDYNSRVRLHRYEIALKTFRWVLSSLIPSYGLDSVVTAYQTLKDYYSDRQDYIRDLRESIEKARTNRSLAERSLRLGRFGDIMANILRLRSPKTYDEDINNRQEELSITNLLVSDPDDSRSTDRLLDFVFDVLEPIKEQIERFKQQAEGLIGRLKQQAQEALQRPAEAPSLHGQGREHNYYDCELDPTQTGKTAFDAFWSQLSRFEHLRNLVNAERILQTDGEAGNDVVKPSPLIQLIGLYDPVQGTRRTGHLTDIAEVVQLLGRDGLPNILSREDWEIESMTQEYILGEIEKMLRNNAGLAEFFAQPLYQGHRIRREMQDGLDTALKNLMDNVQPFWGVKPFPDERDLEVSRFLSLATDPAASPILYELLKEYHQYEIVRGEDPFRLDVLCMEHAARPRHIEELKLCRQVYYERFDEESRKGLHLHPSYASVLPDPFEIDISEIANTLSRKRSP